MSNDDTVSYLMSVNNDTAVDSDESLVRISQSISLRSYNKWSPTEHGVTLGMSLSRINFPAQRVSSPSHWLSPPSASLCSTFNCVPFSLAAWRDVSIYAVKNRCKIKRIINNSTGAITSGSLVALMGASGSGKTTLMSALANRTARKCGVRDYT